VLSGIYDGSGRSQQEQAMWKTVTVGGFEQIIINLNNVCYLARTSNKTEVRFLDEHALYVDEEPSRILTSTIVTASFHEA
jgi:hypothetical protein